MEIEKQRGISVTSSVLQFDYDGCRINILDTPGHQDFSEDTYRTLMAVDSAVMVIDVAKGVEAQTKKLFKVCKQRGIPIFTFINKLDHYGKLPIDIMDEIENVLGIRSYPMNWPIGQDRQYMGVYDRRNDKVLLFAADTTHGQQARIADVSSRMTRPSSSAWARRRGRRSRTTSSSSMRPVRNSTWRRSTRVSSRRCSSARP